MLTLFQRGEIQKGTRRFCSELLRRSPFLLPKKRNKTNLCCNRTIFGAGVKLPLLLLPCFLLALAGRPSAAAAADANADTTRDLFRIAMAFEPPASAPPPRPYSAVDLTSTLSRDTAVLAPLPVPRIEFVSSLATEGGVSERPRKDDPGGPTNYGVTQKTYDSWRSDRGEPSKPVRQMTEEEAWAIYKHNFWDPVKGEALPLGVAYAVFDFALHSGPVRAVKELQHVVGVVADGVLGTRTLSAVEEMPPDQVIDRVSKRRLVFLKRLRNWRSNKKGWTRRVRDVRVDSLVMADDGAWKP